MTHKWYPLNVRRGFESLAATQLRSKGYEVFYPTYKPRPQLSDREEVVDSALFPGYLFCSFDVETRLPILMTPGVLSVVRSEKIATQIEDAEIEAIRVVVGSGAPYQPHPYLRAGKRIRIKEGPLCGVTGLISHANRHSRLVLSIDLLMRSVSVEIDESWAELRETA
jgi:transcription antitermination factor NusG